jgi:hypothetical protein
VPVFVLHCASKFSFCAESPSYGVTLHVNAHSNVAPVPVWSKANIPRSVNGNSGFTGVRPDFDVPKRCSPSVSLSSTTFCAIACSSSSSFSTRCFHALVVSGKTHAPANKLPLFWLVHVGHVNPIG